MGENLNILTLTQGVHKPSSERPQEWIKSHWYLIGFLTPIDRYCAYTERDPVQTLYAISVNILHDRLPKIRKVRIEGVGTLQCLLPDAKEGDRL